MKQIIVKTTDRTEIHLTNEEDIKKAYELFMNPELRAILSNGNAIAGNYIAEIIPNEK